MNFNLRPKHMLAAVLALAGVAQAGDYSSWARYRDVTVNTTALTLGANVTKIPLLVRFNSTDHKDMLDSAATQILAGGADIRVTKADGTTDVPFEIEQATTGASGSLVLWILADNVAQNSATAAAYRVFWGKSGATTLSNSSAVFDTANGFAAVWHMNQSVTVAGDSLLDATVNKNTAKLGIQGTGALVSDTTGGIGASKFFGGLTSSSNTNGSYFVVNDSSTTKLSMNTDNGPYTLSVWANPTLCSSSNRIVAISKYNNNNVAGTRAFTLQTASSGANWRMTNDPASLSGVTTANEFVADTTCTQNEWQYVVGTYELVGTVANDAPSAANVKISLNGSEFKLGSTANQGNGASIGSNAPVFIGRLDGTGNSNNRFMRGALDELRVHKVARNSDWVKLEYETQRPTGGTAVSIGATQTPSAPVADYSTWSHHRDIVINTAGNGANTTSTITNFPLLIRLDAAESDIINAANGGNSIRFSKADDLTPLAYEIDTWTSTAAAIWVKVDSIKGNNSTQKIRMHWGKASAASESNGPAVFDTANGYVGAWHLGNATGTDPRPGSVVGSPAAIVRNGLPPVPGIIGMSDTLGNIPGVNPANGGNPLAGRYIDFGRDASFNDNNYAGFSDFTTGLTFTTWVNATSTAGFTRFIVLGADSSATNEVGSTSRIMFMGNQNQSTTVPNFAVRSNGVNSYNSPANAYSFNTWTNIAVTKVPGSATAYNIYKNGDLLGSSGTGTDPLIVTRNYAWMGRSSASTDGWFGGRFDNVTLSKVARSADYIRLSYQNQKAINAVVNIGPFEYAATAPAVPTAATAVGGTAQATVSWTAPGSNGGAAITGYTVTSAPGALTCTTTGALSCTVTGLTNGTEYTFTVVATNSVGNSAPSLASNAVTPAEPSWSAGRSITLNTSATGAKVSGTVYNFPVLIRLGAAESAILSAAKSDGSDIRFMKKDSTTIIPHEIESWSSTAAAIWVKVDTILGNNATQKIYMKWGNPSATATSNGPAVFDTTNGFVAVYHLNEASGNVMDATGKGNTGTPSATAPTHLAEGLIGPAKTFVEAGANSMWYQIGTDSTAVNLNVDDPSGLTVTAWVNPTSCADRIAAFSKYISTNTPAGRQYALHTGNAPSDWRFTVGSPAAATGEFYADASGTCVEGSWRHVAGTYASAGTATTDSAVNVRVYVDGVSLGSGTLATIAGVGTGGSTYIGRVSNNTRYMSGSLDEITVAAVRRDSNWIKLSYESQKALQAFTNIGVTLPPLPGAPTGLAANLGAVTGTINLTWAAPSNSVAAGVTGYTVTGTPSGSCTTTGALTCSITGLTPGSYSFTVKATGTTGTSEASTAATATVTSIALPGSFVIRMDGARNPYTYRLPTAAIALTDKLTMSITDVQGKRVWTRTINPAANNVSELTWDGTTSKGQAVSPGMYVVRLRAEMGGEVVEAVQRGVKY